MRPSEVFTFRMLRNHVVKIIIALSLSAAFFTYCLYRLDKWDADLTALAVPAEFGQLSWQSTLQHFGACRLITWELGDHWTWQDDMANTAVVPRAAGSDVRYSSWQTLATANEETIQKMIGGVKCVNEKEAQFQTDLLTDFGTGKGMYIRNGDLFLYLSSDKKHLYYLGVDI